MKASESRLKNERTRKRTKSGGCPKNFDQHKNSSPKNSTDETKYSHSLHKERIITSQGSNYKELKIYLGMCLFSSLFYFIIIQINNHSKNLTSILNLNQLACKSSVLQFKIQDIQDELSISFARIFSTRPELDEVRYEILNNSRMRHESGEFSGMMSLLDYLHSIYLMKWIVQTFSLFLLWYCFIIRSMDITNVGTCCDFLKEMIFFITIAELLQIWFPLVWLGIIYFPVKGSYIFWTDFAWQIKKGWWKLIDFF